MAEQTDKYGELGVDAGKGSVRTAFRKTIDNDFPGAFVNIVRDPTQPGMVVTQHGDGDGSKPIQRILAYLITGDKKCLPGAVDDGVSMNTGDVAASGFVDGLMTWTDNLNLGKFADPHLKQTVMEVFGQRFVELRELYGRQGFTVKFLGGETADLPDQVKTSVFDVTVNAREKEGNVIAGNVKPGDVIYGFASDGQAAWEVEPNSGIMSNGLTLAGTCLGWKGYNKEFNLRLENPFTGKFKVGDTDPLLGNMSVFEAMLSPTRHWAILIRQLVTELKRREILHMLHGISMNTGGGATKIGHVGAGILYRKMMPVPPGIFQLIQREGEVSWKEMFKAFNCGVGLDVVGENHDEFHAVITAVSQATTIQSYKLGHTEAWHNDDNKVEIKTPFGTFGNH